MEHGRNGGLMVWEIIIGGGLVASAIAFYKGQNPLIWFFTSVPGVPLLGMMPDAKKGLGEQKRARRDVGDKLGIGTGASIVVLLVILSMVGVL